MANEDDKKKAGDEEPTELYRFNGMKNAHDDTGRLILEGSAVNPVVYLDKGGEPVALTETQVESAKQSGAKISKLSEEAQQKVEEQQEEGAPPKGSTQAPGTPAGREGSAGAQTGSKTGDK